MKEAKFMYNSYEEYMQNVLGMNLPNTYEMQNNPYSFEPRMGENRLLEINKLYPEIYGVLYPMVQKVCARQSLDRLNEAALDEMAEEVYLAIEPGDDILQGKDNGSTPRNGDVKNPRAKESRRPNQNYLLRDLIKILIIRELLQGGNPGWMPGPGHGPGPGPRPRRNASTGRKTTYFKTGIHGDVAISHKTKKHTIKSDCVLFHKCICRKFTYNKKYFWY